MFVDSFMLAAVTRELAAFKGSVVQQVRPVAPFQVALALRGRDRQRRWLTLSAHTRYAHVSWQETPLPNAATDHADTLRFAETLERTLQRARLLGAEQVDFDRLIALRFVAVTPLGERRSLTLWCEIMGKHSNLVLVDEERQVVVDALKRLSTTQNRYREVRPGCPYIRPPTGERRNPLSVSHAELEQIAARQPMADASDWAKWLFGVSEPLLALMQEQVAAPLTQPTAFWQALQWLRAVLTHGAFAPTVWRRADGTVFACYPLPKQDGQPPFSDCPPDLIAERVEAFGPALAAWLNALMQREAVEQRRRSLLSELQRQQAGVEQQLQELQRRWDEAQDAERYRKWGELLLTYAHAVPEGATEAVLTDYDTDPPQTVRVPLPDGKTPVEAAQHYFALYRKLKNAAATLPSVMDRLRQRVFELQQQIERLKAAPDAAVQSWRSQTTPASSSATPADAPVQRDGDFWRFVVANGYEVWVGRNAEVNMRLLRLARPDDVWLHVKGAPGSHALLRVKKRGEEVPHTALEQAAQIAAYFSPRRTAAWVEVDYTRARYVRPVKGQKGLALYTHFKTLVVEPQLPPQHRHG